MANEEKYISQGATLLQGPLKLTAMDSTNVETPASGYVTLFANSSNDNKPSQMDSDGNVTELGTGTSTAAETTVDASVFSGNLSSTDTDVQTALDTIDQLSISSTAANTTVDASGFDGNLSNTDTDVQTALETLNSMTHSDIPSPADVSSSNYGLTLVLNQFDYVGNDSDITLLMDFDNSLVDESLGQTSDRSFTDTGITYSDSGAIGSCAVFDGSSYFKISQSEDNGDWSFDANGTLTIELYFKTTEETEAPLIGGRIAGWAGSWILTTTGFRLRGSSSFSTYSHGQTYADGEWHHVAVVQNGSAIIKIYFDGVVYVTSSIGSPYYIGLPIGSSNATDLWVGYGYGDTLSLAGDYFTGSIDNIRISKVAEFTADFTPPTVSYNTSTIEYGFGSSSTDAITGAEQITIRASESATKAVTHTQAELVGSTPIVSVTASTDDIDKDNQGKLTKVDNDDGAALTLIAEVDDTDTDIPIGGWVDVMNVNATDMTVTAASGVTLNGTDAGSVTISEGQCVRFTKTASDTWVYGIQTTGDLENPMTTVGDIIIGGTSGTPERLAAGTSGYVLTSNGAGVAPSYQEFTGSGLLIADGDGYGLDNDTTNRDTLGSKAVSLEYDDSSGTFGATGDNSLCFGLSTLASGASAISGGTSCISGGDYSICLGYGNTSNAIHSTVSGGVYNTASGGASVIPGGSRAVVTHHCEFGMSSGQFSARGDCQRGQLQYRISTSATDATELFLDGGTVPSRFTISDGDVYSCKIHCMGVQDDGSACDAIYIVRITNQSDTTSLSGSVRTLSALDADTNLGTPTFNITADDTNDSLKITVTPANTTATRWTAVVDYVKIAY